MKRKNFPTPEDDEPQLVLGEIKTSKPPAAEEHLISSALTYNEDWFINYVKHLDSISAENEKDSRKDEKNISAPSILAEPRDSAITAARQSIMTSIPDDILRPNDNATRAITSHNIINKGGQQLNMGTQDDGVPIITTLSLTLNPNFINQLVDSGYVSKEDAANYTHFDNSVMTAICSLWSEQNNVISLQTVYKFMAGFSNSYHPTPNQIQDVKDSLSKLNMIQIKIDLLKEIKDEKLPVAPEEARKLEIQESLLSIRLASCCLVNGNEASVVQILSKPPLLNLAEMRGEVIRFNKKVYSTPVNKSVTVLALQDFLIYQISGIMHNSPDAASNIEILYEDIFENLPLPSSGNKNTMKSFKSKIYENTTKILSYWKSIGYIKGFSIEGKGKTKYYKLIIEPNP